MPTFALSFHGQLLVSVKGAIQLHPINELGQYEPLDIGLTDCDFNTRFKSSMELRDNSEIYQTYYIDCIGIECLYQSDAKFVVFRKNECYLTSLPNDSLPATNRTTIGDWERFLLISADDLTTLRHITSTRWCNKADSFLTEGHDIKFEDNYRIRVGLNTFRLDLNLPLICKYDYEIDVLFSFTLLKNGWIPHRFYRYNPMIFITAFKADEYINQAKLCISSLRHFAKYDGQIHIITDRPTDFEECRSEKMNIKKLTVQEINPKDWVGYVASKYCILAHPDARKHQPLLFLDPDVMADNDISDLLRTIATSDRMLAPLEKFSPLATSPSVGSSLIQRSALNSRFSCGFNGGTLGVPNLLDHSSTLQQIAQTIVNFLHLEGRNVFQWADQEVANFVSFTLPIPFDTHLLLKYVRYGWEGCEYDGNKRIGLVHFFPTRGGRPKSEAMSIYWQTLVNHRSASLENDNDVT